ncbi:tripartite motif-containing protein 26 [Sminthopsis crassicaudata]|uniref:tripartite motif-containing protein 26 n=1 Tax=Sminthopsis crassicaudata TaxID=9301 RepID=UPI003D68ED9C
MATSAPLRTLEEEVTCSICLDYLRDPVTIDCGHVFCRGCVIDIRAPPGGRPACPLCKKTFKKDNIRPVWQLASLVQNIERLNVEKGREAKEKRPEPMAMMQCERHKEKLHYYCEDDGRFLCVMCRESREHKYHTAILIEKAAQPHREKILSHLGTLRRDKEKVQSFQMKGETEIQHLLTKLQMERQNIASEFAQGHQFLREREQHLLEGLEGLEREIIEGREKYNVRTSGELTRLGIVISELEEKAQQPATELMQDTRDFLTRYPRKKFWSGKPIAPAIRKRTGEFSDKLHSLRKGLREFQGKLLRVLEYKTVNVTLDPQTASGYLILSEDWKCVSFTNMYQSLYQYPQQFDPEPAVMGSKGFTWGKVYWEVAVEREGWGEEEGDEEEEGEEEEEEEENGYGEGEEDWETDEDDESGGDEDEDDLEEDDIVQESCLVGIARDTVRRKGELCLSPEDGVWALRLSAAGVWINTNPEVELFLAQRPKRVGIALDYDGGTVTFTNAESQELIYTFSASFTRRLVPFFWLNWPGTSLILKP